MNFLLGSNNTKLQKELEEQRKLLHQQGLELNEQRQKYEDLQKQLRDEIHTQKQIVLTGKAHLDTQVLTSKTRTSKVRTEVLLAVKEVEKKVDANQKKSEQGGKILKVLKETQEKDMSDVNSRLDVAKKQLEKIDAKITTLAVKIPDIVADIDEKAKAHVQRSQRSCVLDLTKKIQKVESEIKEQSRITKTEINQNMSTKMKGITDFLQKMQNEVTEIRKQQSNMKNFMMKYSNKVLDEIEAEKMRRRLGEEPQPKKRRTSRKSYAGPSLEDGSTEEKACGKCRKARGVCQQRGKPGHLPLLDESSDDSDDEESD